MAKKDWGTKRSCPECGARFYDLRRNPIECPKCNFSFVPDTPSRPQRAPTEKTEETTTKKSAVPDELRDETEGKESEDDIDVDVKIDVDDDDDLEEEGEGQSVLEDASDLGGEDDDVPSVREKASGSADDDR